MAVPAHLLIIIWEALPIISLWEEFLKTIMGIWVIIILPSMLDIIAATLCLLVNALCHYTASSSLSCEASRVCMQHGSDRWDLQPSSSGYGHQLLQPSTMVMGEVFKL